MGTSRWGKRGLWLCLTGVVSASFALSFDALRFVALQAATPVQIAWLFPASLDITMILATAIWVHPQTPIKVRRYARFLALSALTVSASGNALGHALAVSTSLWWVIPVGALPAILQGAVAHLAALMMSASKDAPVTAEVPEALPGAPALLEDLPEQLPELPEQLPELPEQLPELPEQLPELPEELPETARPLAGEETELGVEASGRVPATRATPELPDPVPGEDDPVVEVARRRAAGRYGWKSAMKDYGLSQAQAKDLIAEAREANGELAGVPA